MTADDYMKELANRMEAALSPRNVCVGYHNASSDAKAYQAKLGDVCYVRVVVGTHIGGYDFMNILVTNINRSCNCSCGYREWLDVDDVVRIVEQAGDFLENAC